MFKCKFCEKKYDIKISRKNHQTLCRHNPGKNHTKISSNLKNYVVSYISCIKCRKVLDKRQLNKHSNSKSCRKTFNIGRCVYCNIIPRKGMEYHYSICRHNPDNTNILWSEDRKLNHSIRMKRAVKENPESYSSNNVCGRVKIIIYNDVKFHGSWEVEVAKWLDFNHTKWDRLVRPIEYEWNGSIHLYYPDFYLPELNYYIEVKGYKTDRDDAKWAKVKNLIILRDAEIKLIRNNTIAPIAHLVRAFAS